MRTKIESNAQHTFLIIVVIIPEHCCVRHMCLGMSLMRTVQGRELDGIPDEEDRKIVADDIPVPFISEELQSPSANVTDCIR